jgi:Glucose-6-phosphate dehydrogenase subunit
MAHPILDALPGFTVKISEALHSLDKAWANEGEESARASQMNLVLMFGADVTPADAQARFDEAIVFAQRYPCRLVVLAARPLAEAPAPLEAKVNVVCFFDPARRGKRCCEALILAHGAPTPELESLVSTWLEGDLPTNLWTHRVGAEEFKPWLSWTARCRRVVADRSLVGDDFFNLSFPVPASVRDLAVARCLPVRQALGQYLAANAPVDLVRGLQSVTVSYGQNLKGEAQGILAWMRACLQRCATVAKVPLTSTFQINATPPPGDNLDAEWVFADGAKFSWEHAEQGTAATYSFTRMHGGATVKQRIAFMLPSEALSEAVFF